jgi:hypothetical protein
MASHQSSKHAGIRRFGAVGVHCRQWSAPKRGRPLDGGCQPHRFSRKLAVTNLPASNINRGPLGEPL